MPDIKTLAQREDEIVQTTLRLSSELLKRGKVAAIEHSTTLQQLFLEGLELRLALLGHGLTELERVAKGMVRESGKAKKPSGY